LDYLGSRHFDGRVGSQVEDRCGAIFGPVGNGVDGTRTGEGEDVSSFQEMRLVMTAGRVVKVKVFMMLSDW
jgi:hypothetical protein